jgi:hypothetical protein
MEMHRVLREDGSLYLHIDHTAHAWVKTLLDSIFGRQRFVNEIVWCYALGGSSRTTWSRKHDSILFYAKGDKYYFDKPTTPASSNRMKGQDKGMLDWWTDIPSLNNMAKERMGYPTQKPVALYERIIRASSREGDFVLDPFCGCATTPIAAERSGRQWIGMDIWDQAHQVVVERLQQGGLASPDGDTAGRLLYLVTKTRGGQQYYQRRNSMAWDISHDEVLRDREIVMCNSSHEFSLEEAQGRNRSLSVQRKAYVGIAVFVIGIVLETIFDVDISILT